MKNFGMLNGNFAEKKNRLQLKGRRLALENLEDRMLLAVTAGGEAASETALVAAPEALGSVIEITSLTRAAINDAIASAADGDTLHFADSLSGKTITFNRSLSEINKTITIEGNGVTFACDADYLGTGFVVTAGSFTIRNLNFDGYTAGAICIDNASLSLTNCSFTNNTSSRVAPDGVEIAGGAVSSFNSSVSIDGCTFEGNIGSGYGGSVGFRNQPGEMADNNLLLIKNSVFTGNKADTMGRGGAVSVVGGQLKIDGCSFIGNSAVGSRGQGGALYVQQNAGAWIDNSVFQWNYSA